MIEKLLAMISRSILETATLTYHIKQYDISSIKIYNSYY